jgi:Tfp pilus assembly protein PilW
MMSQLSLVQSAQRRRQAGFTLVELLLYLAVTSIIVTSVSGFFITMLEARVKFQVMSEVEQQGAQVMQQMTQTVRNGSTITSPTTGATGTGLTITVPTGALSPTVFDLSGGVIRVTEGAGAAEPLTNNRVTASALSVQNLTRPTTQGVVRIQFVITSVNGSGRNEFSFSKTFRGSATMRQ